MRKSARDARCGAELVDVAKCFFPQHGQPRLMKLIRMLWSEDHSHHDQ